eukprot:6456747-Amphidinium_carterae.3
MGLAREYTVCWYHKLLPCTASRSDSPVEVTVADIPKRPDAIPQQPAHMHPALKTGSDDLSSSGHTRRHALGSVWAGLEFVHGEVQTLQRGGARPKSARTAVIPKQTLQQEATTSSSLRPVVCISLQGNTHTEIIRASASSSVRDQLEGICEQFVVQL